jgi:hypothetical protein
MKVSPLSTSVTVGVRASTIAAFLLAMALVCETRAQFTALYTFPSSGADVPSVSNVSFTAFSGTNVTLGYSSSNQNTSTSGWALNGSAADTSEYLSFGLQANPGYTLDVSQLTFKASRSGTGPSNISIGIFVGGASQGVSSAFTPTNTATATTSAMGTALTYNFADLTSIVATSLVEFRIYGWGATGSTGTLRLDELTVSGAVNLTAVPEPSTYALGAGMVTFVAVLVRRKKSINAADFVQRR